MPSLENSNIIAAVRNPNLFVFCPNHWINVFVEKEDFMEKQK